MDNQGRKYDGGKLRYDLVPALALEEVTKVITKGAEKYDDENWKNVPNGRQRYYAACLRHVQEWKKGNIYDDEMGTHHIANAISNLMFILEKELNGWEDVVEFTTEVEDLTTEQLAEYVQSIEKPWYPPIEEGENPWVEWSKGYCPEALDEGSVVSLLLQVERDLEDTDIWNYAELASHVSWENDEERYNIVAYKIVSV